MPTNDNIDWSMDLQGNLIHNAAHAALIEQYAPPGMPIGPMRYVETMRNWLDAQYPGFTPGEANMMHERYARFCGVQPLWLKGSRAAPYTDQPYRWDVLEDREVIRVCQVFRETCTWWQRGNRATRVMLRDAESFVDILENWVIDYGGNSVNRGQLQDVVNAVELAAWHAVAMVKAIEIARVNSNTDDEPDVEACYYLDRPGQRLGRKDIFKEALESIDEMPAVKLRALQEMPDPWTINANEPKLGGPAPS